jgi:hypothetical protein
MRERPRAPEAARTRLPVCDTGLPLWTGLRLRGRLQLLVAEAIAP